MGRITKDHIRMTAKVERFGDEVRGASVRG